MQKGQEEQAVFGNGCFWCTETLYTRLNGVNKVVSGYAGGEMKSPTYYDVSEGDTGHAEVIQITFDPSKVTYEQILDVFFHTHDPTTLNKQGSDVGTQYRSVILYASDAQQKTAEDMKQKLQSEFEDPIVTEIAPLNTFYEAEQHHQKYFEKNSFQPYCQLVISPKLAKFQKRYKELLKK